MNELKWLISGSRNQRRSGNGSNDRDRCSNSMAIGGCNLRNKLECNSNWSRNYETTNESDERSNACRKNVKDSSANCCCSNRREREDRATLSRDSVGIVSRYRVRAMGKSCWLLRVVETRWAASVTQRRLSNSVWYHEYCEHRQRTHSFVARSMWWWLDWFRVKVRSVERCPSSRSIHLNQSLMNMGKTGLDRARLAGRMRSKALDSSLASDAETTNTTNERGSASWSSAGRCFQSMFSMFIVLAELRLTGSAAEFDIFECCFPPPAFFSLFLLSWSLSCFLNSSTVSLSSLMNDKERI